MWALKLGTYEDAMAHHDPDALWDALRDGTSEEFAAVYKRRHVNFVFHGEFTLLTVALMNEDSRARVQMANHLLDDGVDATRHGPLHRLFAQLSHDDPSEPALVERLLIAGADINEVIPVDGAPVEVISMAYVVPEPALGPFYDVIFAQRNLDLMQAGIFRPIIEGLRAKADRRPDLVRRAEDFLAHRH